MTAFCFFLFIIFFFLRKEREKALQVSWCNVPEGHLGLRSCLRDFWQGRYRHRYRKACMQALLHA